MAYTELKDGRLRVTCPTGDLTEEQKKVWNEALFKSKGKSNTVLGVKLVIAGATANEIVKFTSRVYDGQWKMPSRKTKMRREDRALKQVLDSVPDYWETVGGRKLKSEHTDALAQLGINTDEKLPVTKIDMARSKYYWQKAVKASGYSYCAVEGMSSLQRDVSISKKLTAVRIFAPLANVKFGSPLDSPLQRLMDNVSEPQDGLFADYVECRKYEVESLANVDAEIVSKVDPTKLMCDVIVGNFSWYWRASSLSPHHERAKIEIDCLIEAFYAVCKEMGIMGLVDYNVQGRGYVTPSATKGIMKNVIKLSGTYRRLVKSGFAESVARETVLGEINNNIASRATRPALRFYARTDYKDTPLEEREEVKKVSKPSGRGGGAKRLMTLEEFAAAVAKEKEKGEEIEIL